MSLTEANNFKNTLLSILKRIEQIEQEKRDILKLSVEEKLERSARKYEEELEKTCKYILSKNPISVIKEMNRESKRRKEDTDNEF